MKKYLLLFVILSFFFCNTAIADFYKWEDEKGNTQITDYPPPKEKSAKDIQIHKNQTEDSTNLPSEDDQKTSPKNKPSVVLYTKNDCSDCDKAREYLQSKNISFTEYNMDTDKKAAAQRKEIDDGEDVPFAVINKKYVYGFTENVYDKALKPNP